MIQQISSEMNQAPRRRSRLMVYLRIDKSPTPEDFANLSDEDLPLLEKRWGRPIFAEKRDTMPAQIFLTMTPEKAMRMKERNDAWESGQPVLYESDQEMDEFIYKSLPEQTQQLVSKFRHMLREAWRGDPFALQIVQQLAQASARIVVAKNGQLELVIDDLLGTASILFLHDFSAGRLGICANPHCPSPFFVRSRRTQKFCDMPVCMAYSHRVSANNYWARRKEKEQAKSKKRMKNR